MAVKVKKACRTNTQPMKAQVEKLSSFKFHWTIFAGKRRRKGYGKYHVNFSWSKWCYGCTEIEGMSIVFVYPACLIYFIVTMGLASTAQQSIISLVGVLNARITYRALKSNLFLCKSFLLHLSYFVSHLFSSASSQLCWPYTSCISYTGMKTPPQLCTMPSAASAISPPSWEPQLLTRGWENSSKDNGSLQPQEPHRFIVQKVTYSS